MTLLPETPEATEAARLAALRSLHLLDTPSAPDFEALVALVARHFGCPIAMISLLDENRQWFKAVRGLAVRELPRHGSFCDRAIQGSEALVVEDARQDPRFRDSPLVTGAPYYRFYAGEPLPVEGRNVGTLCLVDHAPRWLDAAQRRDLRDFGLLARALLRAHAEARRAEAALKEARRHAALSSRKARLLQQTERLALLGGWEVDPESSQILWSDEVYRIHERPLGSAISIPEALLHYLPQDRAHLAEGLRRLLAEGEPMRHECDFITAQGRQRRVRIVGECERDGSGHARAVGMMQDITESWQMRQRLEDMRHRDTLTGLANRGLLVERLEDALACPPPGMAGLALVLLDLDNFQDINDRHGHALGDALLCEIAARLRAAAGPAGLAARTGSDEFALLLPVATEADLQPLIDDLAARLNRPFAGAAGMLTVSASLGLALGPRDGASADLLMRQADIALSHGRRLGRGRATLFSPAIARRFAERRGAIELAREALREDWFRPFYQPKPGLAVAGFHGFEALARIILPDGRVISPAGFAAALQDEDAARAIGLAMLDKVTEDLRLWRAAGLGQACAAINVTEADFTGGDLDRRILDRLAACRLPAAALKVEVTETVFLGESAPIVVQTLTRLHAAGIDIALDDFGTGFASLTHLRDFPIQELKIDRSFVDRLEDDPRSARIILSVIEMAHRLGMRVVAEGVERESQHQALLRMGCDIGQGYLYGRPAPAAQAAAFCRGQDGPAAGS
ncbi:EAL domain-containing protein [Roseomonas sp. GC11]|uniref:putative bifunctional diguanylate cyclase/phosphodiesterase n=1 Tax=Roseomonas sp. GC11 TaxID=2950546 RepID=UPI00210C0C91|nr:EAL domain-containing protein [Roseomonas sp. GC11]MCQ4159714.1 EAL domain-containing protein [Roseomonas sp. GC11]